MPTPPPIPLTLTLDCDSEYFKEEIIELSENEEVRLLKIYEGAEELGRTRNILRCKSEARLNRESGNWYVTYFWEIDRDGDHFVGYQLGDRVAPTPTPTAISTPTPLIPPTNTPTPSPTPTGIELEQSAIAQGYDLRRLTDLSDLGFTSEIDTLFPFTNPSESARFSLAGTRPLSISTITNAPNRAVIRFEREYEPEPDVYVNRRRDPYVDDVAILLDLYESEAEAAAFVQAFEFTPPGCWPVLFEDINSYRHGFEMGILFYENAGKLEVPIEGVAGFHLPTSNLSGFIYDHDWLHIYFLSHGRMAGYLLVQGDNLGVEDTISLAAELTGPPTPTDDAQEPERNLQSLCELFEVLGNL